MHSEIVLHRSFMPERPFVDRGTQHFRFGHRCEFSSRRRTDESRNGAFGVIGLSPQRRNLLTQLRRQRPAHARHQREHLLPLFIVSQSTRCDIALLMTIGALSHEFFALHIVVDFIEEKTEPAIRGKLSGERSGIRFALEAEVKGGRGLL